MKTNLSPGRLAVVASIAAISLFATTHLRAQQFLPAGPATDSTTSLGKFTIVVNPTYAPFVTGSNTPAGYTWDSVKKTLTSPLLFDNATSIDRSATTTVGSANYNTGLTVGNPANGTVKASDLILPPNYTPPAGEDTVFTKIHTFDLSNGSGTDVKVGMASSRPSLSKGEVTSNATGGNIGNPNNDFPATSFFDIFVDITLPGFSTPLQNDATEPLIIEHPAITSFPPVVIYTHGNSNSVSLRFTGTNPFGAPVGDVFGEVVLAGHGAGYSNSSTTDQNNFNNTYQSMQSNQNDYMPLPAAESSWGNVPSTPEPASIALMALGLATLGLRRGRRPVSQP